MNVEVSVSPLAGLPAPVGAHELAWSYLLDAVMADAHRLALGALHVSVPAPDLSGELQLRAALSRGEQQPAGAGVGAALLGSERTPATAVPADATRLYSLEFGVLAARALRRVRTETRGWRLEEQLSVYCLGARLWGVPIRAAALLGRADLGDRAMFGMRRTFASPRRRPAFYHLTIWGRV